MKHMTLVRIYGRPGYFGVNDGGGTRVLMTKGILSVRAMLRDIYRTDLPALRGDMEPLTPEETAETTAPLYTDRHGCLISDLYGRF